MKIDCDLCGREIDGERALRWVLEDDEITVCSTRCLAELLRERALEEALPAAAPAGGR